MEASIPPIIVKHHLFERLETLSRDWQKVCSLRSRLEAGITPEGLVERLVENRVCSPELGGVVLERWLRGPRFDVIRDACLAISQAIGQDGPYLEGWWILGVSDSVRVEHLALDDRVLLLLLTPHQPLDVVMAKARGGVDPTGPVLAAAYRGAIDRVLTELAIPGSEGGSTDSSA